MARSPLKLLIQMVFTMIHLAIGSSAIGLIVYIFSVDTMTWAGKLPAAFFTVAVACTAIFYFALLYKVAIKEEDERVAKQETYERP